MVRGHRQARPHTRRRAQHAVEPGHVHHLDDGADTTALLANQPGQRLVVLDLGRRVGPVASLSFSRCRRIPFLVPSGRTLGIRKQDSPPGAWASTMNTSPIGAEVNHLCPVSRYSPGPAGMARVVFARTSEPPCFSVIDM